MTNNDLAILIVACVVLVLVFLLILHKDLSEENATTQEMLENLTYKVSLLHRRLSDK